MCQIESLIQTAEAVMEIQLKPIKDCKIESPEETVKAVIQTQLEATEEEQQKKCQFLNSLSSDALKWCQLKKTQIYEQNLMGLGHMRKKLELKLRRQLQTVMMELKFSLYRMALKQLQTEKEAQQKEEHEKQREHLENRQLMQRLKMEERHQKLILHQDQMLREKKILNLLQLHKKKILQQQQTEDAKALMKEITLKAQKLLVSQKFTRQNLIEKCRRDQQEQEKQQKLETENLRQKHHQQEIELIRQLP